MTNDDYSRRPEPIPPAFASLLLGVTTAQLDELAGSASRMLADGRTEPEVVQYLAQAGWDQSFSQWFVGVFASGGRVDTSARVVGPPVFAPPDPGNWFDKQAAPYREGSFALWFHVFCCQCPGLLIGLILSMGCRTEQGKANAGRLMKYSLAGIGVGILLRVLIELAAAAGK